MANYINIKQVESIVLQWQEKETGFQRNEKTQRKLKREAGKRSNKDNALKGKTTQDHHLIVQSSKRLKTHLLFREEPQE